MTQLSTNETFKAKDGTTLFYRFWKGSDSHKNLIIVHGFGEHSGRYETIVRDLKIHKFNIFAADLRGHGKSGGVRGDARSIDSFCEDLQDFLSVLKKKHHVKGPVMLGHSLGGLIAIRFAEKFAIPGELHALAVTAPALGVVITPLMFLKKIVAGGLKIFFPRLQLSVGLDVWMLSHDKNVVQSYKDDPLVHGLITSRLALSVLKTGPAAIHDAPGLHLPIYIAHGGSDRIANPELVQKFHQSLETSNVTYRIYPELYHEIFNELEDDRNVALSDFQRWLLGIT